MHSISMQDKRTVNPQNKRGKEHMKAGTIKVTNCIEHEDGSATFVVDTDTEATRLLVEVGLQRLIEMAINQEEGYEFKKDVPEATESSVQEKLGQS